jgi:hypothetical protein
VQWIGREDTEHSNDLTTPGIWSSEIAYYALPACAEAGSAGKGVFPATHENGIGSKRLPILTPVVVKIFWPKRKQISPQDGEYLAVTS